MIQARRQLVGASSVLLLVAVFGLGLLTESPDEPGAILYAIPVVLVAIALAR